MDVDAQLILITRALANLSAFRAPTADRIPTAASAS